MRLLARPVYLCPVSPIICPTVTAADADSYRQLIEQVAAFAGRLHIDVSDGSLAPNRLLAPRDVWWPAGLDIDVHVMSRQPDGLLDELLAKRPQLVIVHAEAAIDLRRFTELCHRHGVRAGVALLQSTTAEAIQGVLSALDHVLVFSGNLGHFGGQVDMSLTEKVKCLKSWQPEIEVGWDGGVSQQNAAQLAAAGVDVLNTGGAIQRAVDPAAAYRQLQSAVRGYKA